MGFGGRVSSQEEWFRRGVIGHRVGLEARPQGREGGWSSSWAGCPADYVLCRLHAMDGTGREGKVVARHATREKQGALSSNDSGPPMHATRQGNERTCPD